jgi:hypothetical protein
MCTLNRDDTNPAVWFSQLIKMLRKLIDNYKLTSYEVTDVLQHIMYSTKPAMYQLISGINNDCLAHETIQHATNNTYDFTVTLDSVQEEFIKKFATSKKTYTLENPTCVAFDYTFT